MSTTESIMGYVRYARHLRSFLREPFRQGTARQVVRERLANRETTFLQQAEQMIFGNPSSPYLKLLTMAGCEFGDFKATVQKEGIEQALQDVEKAGVYLTRDEFRGWKPTVRGSQTFHFTESDFDNPCLASHFDVRSSGSTGRGMRVWMHLDFLADSALDLALVCDSYDLWNHTNVVWSSVGGWALINLHMYSKLALPPHKWFSHVDIRDLPRQYLYGTALVVGLSRICGSPLPWVETVSVNRADDIASWLQGLVCRGDKVFITTYVSSAVRIARAAVEHGYDLRPVIFLVMGEPCSDVKRAAIEASGAEVIVRYAATEVGTIAYSCKCGDGPDDLHLLSDIVSVIGRRRPTGERGPEVNSLVFTSLLRTAPKILLNLELGDYGVLQERSCGCELGAAGLTTHISHINSFEKLTSEGVNFVASHLGDILEDVLPSRFGGCSLDYQLMEEEKVSGLTKLVLLASPGVGSIDEGKLREVFFDALKADSHHWKIMARIWEDGDYLEIRREPPAMTPTGKILHFFRKMA